jgi:DNA-binding NtrC family response regulator
VTGRDSTLTTDADADVREYDNHVQIPRLVVALSWQQPLVPGMRICLVSAREVLIGRGAPRAIRRDGQLVEVTLDDRAMSRRHVLLRRLPAAWELEDLGSKNGTLVNGARCTRRTLDDGDVIEAGSTILLFREDGVGGRSTVEACRDRDLAHDRESGAPVVARTLALDLERQLSNLVSIAASPVAVMLRGETGTGKELIARAVHELSGRQGAFVAINCGALPRTLIESELFGYRRGSFSEAREDRDGLVRAAHAGTLFLDEIAELPPESQVALLRVLQDGEVRPVGARDIQTVDLRVVAATNQDMERKIALGTFRQDLYARLGGFKLALPPLRDRREDVGTVLAAILARLGSDAARVTLHRQAARALFAYPFPLNIRELELAVRAAVVLAQGRQIGLEHLPDEIRDHRAPATERHADDSILRERLHEVLRQTRGNVSAAARALEKGPTQIRRWCQRFAIDPASFRG